MQQAVSKRSIASAMLGTLGILTLGAYSFARVRLPLDLIVQESLDAAPSGPDGNVEIGPLGVMTLTDDRLLLLLLLVAGAFAVGAVGLGLFGKRRTNNDHFLTTGTVFGYMGILWISLIALRVI